MNKSWASMHEHVRSKPGLADNSAYCDRRPASKEKPMCPVCLTTAVLIAGSATSTGGLAAIAIRKIGMKKAVDNHPAPTASEEDHHG
jgi:hypothetical protein